MPVDYLFDLPEADLVTGALVSGEAVLHHWPSPTGRGVLTNLRLLLAGHPHPVHREVLWAKALEAVGSFAVVKAPDVFVPTFGIGRMGAGFSRGSVGWDKLDEYYAVHVDNVTVFLGYIEHCEQIQRWIDEAWMARKAVHQPPGPERPVAP